MVECHGSGSPMYLAPETVLERPVSCAVDIWACGVILYLLLVSISTDTVVKRTALQFYETYSKTFQPKVYVSVFFPRRILVGLF